MDVSTLDHYPKSPSAAGRWRHCPGSIGLCETYPSRENEYSRVGTEKHSETDLCLRHGTRSKHPDYADDVNLAIDAIESIREHYKSEPLFQKFESKLVSKRHRNFGGTLDYLGVWQHRDFKVGEIVDFKFGFQKVAAEDNDQGKCYTLLAREFYPDVSEWHFTIVQPLDLWLPVKHVKFSADELDEMAAVVDDVDRNKSFKWGAWCGNCSAQTHCREFDRGLMAMVRRGFDSTDWPAEWKRALEAEPAVKKFYAKLREEVADQIRYGEKVDGFKIVKQQKHKTWLRDADETARILEARGVENFMHEPKIKTPTQIASRKKYAAIIDDLFYRPPGGHILVSADDKRPAIQFQDPKEAFRK